MGIVRKRLNKNRIKPHELQENSKLTEKNEVLNSSYSSTDAVDVKGDNEEGRFAKT